MSSAQSWIHARGWDRKLGSKSTPAQTSMAKMQRALASTSRSSWSRGPCPQHPCPYLHTADESKQSLHYLCRAYAI